MNTKEKEEWNARKAERQRIKGRLWPDCRGPLLTDYIWTLFCKERGDLNLPEERSGLMKSIPGLTAELQCKDRFEKES